MARTGTAVRSPERPESPRGGVNLTFHANAVGIWLEFKPQSSFDAVLST